MRWNDVIYGRVSPVSILSSAKSFFAFLTIEVDQFVLNLQFHCHWKTLCQTL